MIVPGHEEQGLTDDIQGWWKYVYHERGSSGESWPGSSVSMSTATWGDLSQYLCDSFLFTYRGRLYRTFWEEMSDHFQASGFSGENCQLLQVKILKMKGHKFLKPLYLIDL